VSYAEAVGDGLKVEAGEGQAITKLAGAKVSLR
jgi:hypothetical protein